MNQKGITLLELQAALQRAVAETPQVQNQWVRAELSDVAERGGHCYMELIQKNESTGANDARARATIWANRWQSIKYAFQRATGQQFASGLKVLVKVSAQYHPVYGMSLNITDVDVSFTLGERERRRREILERLKRDGTIDMNRELALPRPCLRIAVVSAAGAAGYGDFINQLYANERNLRFTTQLFPAVMQGPQTAETVIAALDLVAAEQERWDCVCIIRGGGASTDLDGFDDYALASNVAQFCLPVIIGIGHERDTTVLDYICSQRVKTPTAAAELLVGNAVAELETLHRLAAGLLQSATDAISGAQRQLAYMSGSLPVAPLRALDLAGKRLDRAAHALSNVSSQRLLPLGARLDRLADAIAMAAHNRIALSLNKLQGSESLLRALSPQAVLARGFSITRVDGHAVTNAAEIPSGAIITTTLAQGELTSKIFS